jgi:hypothetical protein
MGTYSPSVPPAVRCRTRVLTGALLWALKSLKIQSIPEISHLTASKLLHCTCGGSSNQKAA